MQTYGQEVAEAIIGNYCDDLVEINEKGVWTKRKDLEILQWRPVCELDGPDSPDPFTTPGLPIPFNVNELAAFMINGPGVMVLSAYGDWQDGPYDEILQTMGILATKAKEALRGAYAAYREAERIVGTLDMNTQNLADSLRAKLDTENSKANKRVKLYEKGISDLEYSTRRAKAREFIREISEKTAEASLLADKEHKAWVNAMVNQLLRTDDELSAISEGNSTICDQTITPNNRVLVASTASKPVQRFEAQDRAILLELKNLGYDPKKLPKNPKGKPGVKAAVRTRLSNNKLFVGTTIFNKAWERLTARSEIVLR